MVFFTKKQKSEFRKRRRRQQKQTDDECSPTGSSKNNNPKEDHAGEKSSDTGLKQEPDNSLGDVSPVVIVPKGLSAQEAKKFRKDARRKAKAEGKDPAKVEFVLEGSKPKEAKEEKQEKAIFKMKKRKRDFPCLNDLVREEEKVKKENEAENARKMAEEALSEEYKSRYLALDCEMVGIGTDGKRSVLARVSIVDWNGKTVFDTFVQVPTRVTDFRTHVSGVTAKNIKSKSGAMKDTECRQKVAKILQGKVLVGHALKNDLDALLLTHPKGNIRDTAKYRPFQRLGGTKWRPRKLRDLVKENLDIDIQQEGQAHDSVEDAWATMQLFRVAREKWEEELQDKLQNKRRKT